MDFIEQFSTIMKAGLPGEECHLEVSPLGRKKSSDALLEAVSPKESAVAILLFEKNGFPSSLLIERSVYNGSHSGQIAFPGGKKDDLDLDLCYTARRECFEEIGVASDALELVGALTPVYIPVSNFKVQPFVFWVNQLGELKPNPDEVVDIFDFPLRRLKEDCLGRTSIQVTEVMQLNEVPYFDINGRVVWGATALMLNEMRVLIRKI
jgi:8-oxo-dGTP pyrophosphatase MutT (NUDIX family)